MKIPLHILVKWNSQLMPFALSSVHIVGFCVQEIYYNGRKIVQSSENSVILYRFPPQFCESRDTDARTHRELDYIQRVELALCVNEP
jgi:hypothetical protein